MINVCVLFQVYYISKASLKIANKQYTSVKNDYEMTLNGESTIIPCEDNCDVPMMQYDFVTIGDLENREKDATVGKAHNAPDLHEWNLSEMTTTTGKILFKLLVSLSFSISSLLNVSSFYQRKINI